LCVGRGGIGAGGSGRRRESTGVGWRERRKDGTGDGGRKRKKDGTGGGGRERRIQGSELGVMDSTGLEPGGTEGNYGDCYGNYRKGHLQNS